MTIPIPPQVKEDAIPARLIKNGILAVGQRVLVFEKRVGVIRQALYINNLSTTDKIFLKQADSDTSPHITIRRNSDAYFEPQEVLFFQDPNPEILHAAVRCDWTEEVWLENPSTGS